MDRARDVLRVIWRSVFPASAWLRAHYGVHAGGHLTLYRLLHPLRVCYLAVTRVKQEG
jgi:hypothetical protein